MLPEPSSNGSVEEGGPSLGGVGPGIASGVGYQDSLRRCSQRKKSDLLLLGCASLLASVGLGLDLLQLGRLQVTEGGRKGGAGKGSVTPRWTK